MGLGCATATRTTTTGRSAMTATPDTHTTEQQRERSGTSLLRSAASMTYDPVVDIDWDAPLAPDRYYEPPHRCSLYGTALWDAMDESQRIELTKHEVASI